MRRSRILLATLVLTAIGAVACGGGGDPTSSTTPPPVIPPDPPVVTVGPPASITVQQGDNQTGEPGVALPVRPSVLIKDAGSRVVSGVVVTFAIDSGGGTIASGQATTGADGVATAGTWTLGVDEGRNTLLVSTAGVTAVKLAAASRVPAVDIATGQVGGAGGSIVISRPGTPLDGLRITVPDSAFDAAVSFTVRQSSSSGIVLPDMQAPSALRGPLAPGTRAASMVTGTVAVTPVITIVTNGPAYANGELWLKVPLPPNTVQPIVAVVDSLGNPVAFLPIVSIDGTSVTVTTAALDPNVFRQIGNIPQPIPGPHSLSIVIFKRTTALSLDKLYGFAINTSWRFGWNDFAFSEFPTINTPIISPGMAFAEYACFSMCARGLFHTYDAAQGVVPSDVRGITLASGLTVEMGQMIGRYGPAYMANWRLISTPASAYDFNVASIIINMLYYTRSPVPVFLTDGFTARVVLVIGWDPAGQKFYVRDPYYGAATALYFTNGTMVPYPDPSNANIRYHTAFFSWSYLMWLWPKISQQTSLLVASGGTGPYPGSMRDTRMESWSPMIRGADATKPDSVFVLGDTTRLWPATANPKVVASTLLPVLPGWGQQDGWLYSQASNGNWNTSADKVATSFPLDWSASPDGKAATYGVAVVERAPNASFGGWAGWREVRVVRYGISITPDVKDAGEQSTFTPKIAATSPAPPSNARYEWNFGDGLGTTTTGPTVVTHTYTGAGSYNVVLRVIHPTKGIDLAMAKYTAAPDGAMIWRFTQFTPASLTPNSALNTNNLPNQGGVNNADHVTWWKADSTLMVRLTLNPATGLLVYLRKSVTVGNTTYRAGLYLQSDPTGTPGKTAAFDPTQTLIPLGRTPGEPFPDVYAPPLLGEPYADAISSTGTAITGSSIITIRDFTGLPAKLIAAQRRRVLLAWNFSGNFDTAQFTGSATRTQSLWAYLPNTAAQGMYWYNLSTTSITFAATRVP